VTISGAVRTPRSVVSSIARVCRGLGILVYVSGRLSSRTWTGRDGVERWELEIIAEDIQFLSAKAAGYPPAAVAS
jgi:single-stranded DNA-binding protein